MRTLLDRLNGYQILGPERVDVITASADKNADTSENDTHHNSQNMAAH